MRLEKKDEGHPYFESQRTITDISSLSFIN
jgi:hypothetical protein